MSTDAAPEPQSTVHPAEMNGRIEELVRQRDAALTRCATLSGLNGLLRTTLAEARESLARLAEAERSGP